jgi:hypothetical protein
MAIAIDTTATVASNGSNPSWSHTCTGSDLAIVVLIPRFPGSTTITAVSYNGVALTQAISSATSAGNDRADIWYLVNPATGAHTVAVTSSTVTGTIGSVSYTGVHQTVPVGTGVAATGNSATPTVNASSATDEVVVGCCSADGAAGTPTMGADQNSRWAGVTNGQATAASDEPGAATTTHSYGIVSTRWAIAALPIKPSGGAAAPPRQRLSLLGVA